MRVIPIEALEPSPTTEADYDANDLLTDEALERVVKETCTQINEHLRTHPLPQSASQ